MWRWIKKACYKPWEYTSTGHVLVRNIAFWEQSLLDTLRALSLILHEEKAFLVATFDSWRVLLTGIYRPRQVNTWVMMLQTCQVFPGVKIMASCGSRSQTCGFHRSSPKVLLFQKGIDSSPSQHFLQLCGHKIDINYKSIHFLTSIPPLRSSKNVGALPCQDKLPWFATGKNMKQNASRDPQR